MAVNRSVDMMDMAKVHRNGGSTIAVGRQKQNVAVAVAKSFVVRSKDLKEVLATHRLIVGLLALFVILGTSSVFFQGLMTKEAYACGHARTEWRTIHQENAMLKLDVAELKSPGHIQTIAIKDLGMVFPKTFIYAGDKARVVKRGDAVAPIVD